MCSVLCGSLTAIGLTGYVASPGRVVSVRIMRMGLRLISQKTLLCISRKTYVWIELQQFLEMNAVNAPIVLTHFPNAEDDSVLL